MEESESTVKKLIWGPWATAGFGLIVGIVFILTQAIITIVYAIAKYASKKYRGQTFILDR